MEFTDEEIDAFQVAMVQGHIAIAQSYLERGLPVDATASDFPYTALYRTIHQRHEHGYLEWLRFLLDAGANPNHPQGKLDGQLSPLFLAIGHNIFDAMKLLLERGADPNLSFGGGTCLHIIAFNPRVEMLQLLLDYGADFGIKDDEGKLPMDVLEESREYRKKSMPGFTGFENEVEIRRMMAPK